MKIVIKKSYLSSSFNTRGNHEPMSYPVLLFMYLGYFWMTMDSLKRELSCAVPHTYKHVLHPFSYDRRKQQENKNIYKKWFALFAYVFLIY